MPIGTSDGRFYKNEFEFYLPPKEASGGSTELTDALKSTGGTNTTPETQATPEPSNWLDKPFSKGSKIGNAVVQRTEDVIKGLVSTAWEALKAPGEAAQGKLPMWAMNEDGTVNTSPQVIQKAADLAGLAVMGPAPVARKMADGTLGSFAGVKSKNINSVQLRTAQKMEEAGADSDRIWNTTGFFKGTDGHWKYEISDEKMALKDRDWYHGETGKLHEFVDHPELYNSYPEIKDINFKVADKDSKYLASYNAGKNLLTINPSAIKSGDKGILDVLSHELQHWIQAKEGFTTGSNPTHALQEAQEKLNEALRKKFKNYNRGDVKAADDIQKTINLQNDIADSGSTFGQYMYQRNPGEVEANLVAARRLLDDKTRKAFSPKETLKILEGSENSLTGGKYRPEFRYPE